jgi:hypothetical protein
MMVRGLAVDPREFWEFPLIIFAKMNLQEL